MTFAYPGLLWGLLLGAIPIIVYYLMRFRSMRVYWGADYILERALARRRKQIYWDLIVLLTLRVLVVMALVTAFARPQSRKAGIVSTGGQVLRVVLVDGSYSMLAGESHHSRRDVAMEALRELVSRWGRNEKWSLYALDGHPRWVVDQGDIVSAERSVAIVDSLKSEEASVSLAAGLDTVMSHGTGMRREIYIFSDDQASAWAGADKVKAADANTRIFWINPSLADRRNLAVTSVEAGHERVLRGQNFTAYAQVRNFSQEAVRDAELTFLVDNARVGAKRVTLPPGQSVTVPMKVRLDAVGPHLITARLSDDALAFDNAMSVGVEAVNSVSVLVLRDAAQTEKFVSSSAQLQLAARVLAGGGTNEAAGPLRVSEYVNAACPISALTGYGVVVLDGGRALTPDLAKTLRSYVDQGGGLVLAADDTVDLAAWKRLLDPAGLLPAPLLRVRNEKLDGDVCSRLSRSGFDLPGLRDLEIGTDGDVTQVRFYTWVEFGTPGPGVEALARFTDGAPYALKRRFERGSVVLLAAGLNSRNNNLMVREAVYPFLVNLMVEASSADQYVRRVKLGEPVRFLARGGTAPVAAQFAVGEDEPVPANLAPHPQGTRVEYAAGAKRSGAASLLVLGDNAHERIWLGVQGERSDSDLSSITSAYREQLKERFGWSEVGNAKELMDALESDGRGTERYAWVMFAMLLFAMGEILMGLRFV